MALYDALGTVLHPVTVYNGVNLTDYMCIYIYIHTHVKLAIQLLPRGGSTQMILSVAVRMTRLCLFNKA